jgi:hypothetical protein
MRTPTTFKWGHPRTSPNVVNNSKNIVQNKKRNHMCQGCSGSSHEFIALSYVKFIRLAVGAVDTLQLIVMWRVALYH